MTPRRIQRFEVLGELGSGGMGTVYRAHDPQLEREVAIKVLSQPMQAAMPALSPTDTIDLRHGGPSTPDDLLREARMMARLSHPNVLPVYEVGLSDGAVFVVMEYIAGSDLARWLAAPRTTEQILAVFAQAAHGLAAAHAHGIVHRDFKPANVLLGGDGRVRVADFGLSRLTAGTGSMVQLDDGHGTPRYMAPELWRGTVASPASDVFALCAAVIDALGGDHDSPAAAQAWRDRKLAPELRAALARGIADDPAARPALAELIALLEPRPVRRRWLAVSAVVGVLAVGGGIAAALAVTPGRDGAELACQADPALFVGRWDPARRAQVIARLSASPAPDVIGVLGALDERQRAVEDQLAAGCVAASTGQLVARDVEVRTSCLERRAFQIGAMAERVIVGMPSAPRAILAGLARDRIEALSDAAECVEVTAPALVGPRGPVIALYDRWFAAAELAISAADTPAHLAALTSIEHDAGALGERELATRAAYVLGVALQFDDKLTEADVAEQRAYREALELHATNLIVNVLVERGASATLRGDTKAASQLAQLAQDTAAHPTTSVRTHARLQVSLGRTALERGDYKAAIAAIEDGLALIARTGGALPGIEGELRFDLTNALIRAGRAADSVRVARENVENHRRQVGEDDPNYGVALNMLAFALGNADQPAEAAAVRRQALAVMQATQPANSSHIVLQRADVASDLSALGELEAAHREMVEVVKLTEQNQTLAGYRADLLQQFAVSTFEVGRFDDGMRLIDEALESTLAKFGKDHQSTCDVRETLLDFARELGKPELAQRQLTALEASYRAQNDAARLAFTTGALGSELATDRGKPVAAERASRDALTALDELHGKASQRSAVYHALGEALIAQHRWADARDALDHALALARTSQARADTLAEIDIDIARVDSGLGHRAAAHARAIRARAVLDKFPAALRARKRVEPLLR
ncbi:MAG TPA: protein kinase [Kofleriaceae bacterium]|nr:protein kinase [Kofleriaceae bacterium]